MNHFVLTGRLFEICKEVKYLKLTTCENCEHYFIKNLNEHVQ
jgi:hypothetical protein